MSDLARATSYEKSVGSCGPPTPTTAPPHPAPAASVRRQLDFSCAGYLENEDDDIERGYSRAKLRAPECVCGRGVCVVERDDQSARWKYVCPSQPRCKHVAFYKEVDLNPKSQPSSWNRPEPVNPCAFNIPSNHIAGPRTPVSTQVTGAATPDSVRPQVAGATTLLSGSPQCAGAMLWTPLQGGPIKGARRIRPNLLRPVARRWTKENSSRRGERCKHVAFYEEVDLNPKSQPSSWNHPEPVNPRAFNFPSNRMAGPGTPVSIRTQVTGAATPDSVRPQVAGVTTLFSGSPQCAGATTLANISNHGGGTATLTNDIAQGVGAVTPAKFIPQGAFAATPAKVSPQGAGAMTLVHVGGTATLTSDISQGGGATTLAKFIPQDAMAATPAKLSPQGAKSNEPPVCQCTAGKCRKQRIGKEDWYVCTIPKGKGACSYRVLVRDFDQGIGPSAHATPCDETHQVSPSMLHQPTATVNTPPISPMRPFGNPSPITPN